MRSISIFFLILLLLPVTARALFWDKLVLLPRLRCLIRFALLRFDINNYDQYDRYFREDSEFQLVETGTFLGLDDIKEYVVAGSSSAPYWVTDGFLEDFTFRFGGYDRREGLCKFSVKVTTKLTSDPEYTKEAATFRSGTLGTLFLDLEQGYIRRQNAFLYHGFWLSGLVYLYDSDNTRNLVCSVMENECAGYLPEGAADDCLSKLSALPMYDYDGQVRFQENSQVCRVVHAGLAAVNPQDHCAHISFEPMEDPKGRIKCQTGSDKAKFVPLDLFSQEELDDFYDYVLEQGLGPNGTVFE